jgi:16S rRNA (guanine966-N2)-methyltransferase
MRPRDAGSRRSASTAARSSSSGDDPHRALSGLRIIGGTLKGRRLAAPPGLATRPLPDRVKQSLFDWLGQRLDGLRVVDCCAGSGSFAFEALSRGAAHVDAIEPGPVAAPVLRANAARLGNPSAVVVHALPFQAVLPRLADVDLVFADPPFAWYRDDAPLVADLLRLGAGALKADGRLVIRGERGTDLPAVPAGLVERERRTYGRSWLALLTPAAGRTGSRPRSA